MASSKIDHAYSRRQTVGGRQIALRRLSSENRDDMLAFARGLSEEDLLFLRSDITQDAVIDKMVAEQQGDQRVNLLAYDGGTLVGYGSVSREPLTWTRHLGELRVIVGAEARGLGLGAVLTREIFKISRDLGLRKVIARMPLRQDGARRMFERLGFSAEALLHDWVIDRSGKTHDLVVMSYDVTSLT